MQGIQTRCINGVYRWDSGKVNISMIFTYSIPMGPYSVQSIGAAEAVSLAIGHNPGQVTTTTQDTSKLALI